jgi:hypothetical protein
MIGRFKVWRDNFYWIKNFLIHNNEWDFCISLTKDIIYEKLGYKHTLWAFQTNRQHLWHLTVAFQSFSLGQTQHQPKTEVLIAWEASWASRCASPTAASRMWFFIPGCRVGIVDHLWIQGMTIRWPRQSRNLFSWNCFFPFGNHYTVEYYYSIHSCHIQ